MMATDDDDPFAALEALRIPEPEEHPSNIFSFPPREAYANEFLDHHDAPRTSKFFSAADLAGKAVPERQWLVPAWIPHKTVTLFGGDGGTGKSLLALQLAVACATQSEWLNLDVTSGRVIFMSAEDDEDELHRRLHAILTAERLSYADCEGLTMRSLAGEDALLAVDSQMHMMASELYRELEGRAEIDAPTLIIIDTLADVYPANENDRAKVRQFIGLLRGLALKMDCAVVLLGHPSLSGLSSGSGTSGSTAWNNSVRSRLYLERIHDEGMEPDPDARILSNKKANYGRIGAEIHLKYEDGRFAPDVNTDSETSLDRMSASAKAERVFLKLLERFTAEGRYVSAQPGPTYAPTQFASHQGAEGCTKRVLTAAMNMLFQRGRIEIAHHGRPGKERSHIAIAENNQ